MWSYNEKYLLVEVGGGSHLNKSGCYHAIIKKLELLTTPNGAKQVKFEFDVEGNEQIIWHTYSKTDGTEIDFKVRHLNHLLYLNKLKDPSKIQVVVGKEIGVFLKAKLSQDKKFINFDIDGFFHTVTKKTAKEFKEGLEAKTYDKMKKMYEEEKPLERLHEKSTQEQITSQVENAKVGFDIPDDDDEFPF